jgi:hypothetical protein
MSRLHQLPSLIAFVLLLSQPVVKRHLEKATECFNAVHTAVEPFARPKRDEFAVFSGMTSTVRAATSTPLSLLQSSPESLTEPSPSPPQETHRAASGVTPQPSQPAGSQAPLRPAGLQIETTPWCQVHPALIDQLVAFEAQIAPSPVAGGHPDGRSPSAHTPQIPFPFPMPTRPASPPRLTYLQQVPLEHPPPHDLQYAEGSSPTSTMPDANVIETRWGAPHTDIQPQFARPRTPPSDARARDRVIRQSGDLSLTEAWSQFLSQMDIPPVAPQRLA